MGQSRYVPKSETASTVSIQAIPRLGMEYGKWEVYIEWHAKVKLLPTPLNSTYAMGQHMLMLPSHMLNNDMYLIYVINHTYYV